jgi:hypothetical protein
MGEKYEVMEWCNDITNGEGYRWVQEYYGRSLFKALLTLFKLNRAGAGCTKLIVR